MQLNSTSSFFDLAQFSRFLSLKTFKQTRFQFWLRRFGDLFQHFYQSVFISLYNQRMTSINKEKSGSQFLLNQLMTQEKEHHINSLNPHFTTHTKPIHKRKRQTQFAHKKKQEDKFSRHLTKDIGSSMRPEAEGKSQETAESWLLRAKQWYLWGETKADACIREEMNKLPILSSIQQLFSLSSTERLTNEVELDCFYRYCRTVSFLDGQPAPSILLLGERASGVGHTAVDRHGTHALNSICLLSLEQAQVLQKRVSFMEKIKENESKYDASIGRMSEVSKELAFNYRVYLEKRTQLADSLHSLTAKIPPPRPSHEPAYQQYTHLLLRKNLKNAFSRTEIDPLNYFKFKEHAEADRLHSFRHIITPEELRGFIDRRRPKRGRKTHLATACSVCLSDYHEMSNPFQACSGCGLRAHRLCYSFERARCGNCAYQKIEKHLKQQVPACLLCRQPGLMTVKLAEKQFAHAFCLLLHGFWKLRDEPRPSHQQPSFDAASGKYSSEVFLQDEFRSVCNEIEFLNPNQQFASANIPLIDSTLYGSHQMESIEGEMESDSSLGGIGIIEEREDLWNHPEQTRKNSCKVCHQSFYKNCYLTCGVCRQETHALCAFLSGFDLTLSENSCVPNIEHSIALNCCCERSNQVSWSRKYRLNYERMAFNIDGALETNDRDPMQNEKDGLLFNI